MRGLRGRAAVQHHADAARAVLGTVGDMGTQVPVWDIAEKFGDDTDLAVSSMERARDLAQRSAAIASC